MKWVGFAIVLIPLFKWLAYLERGYRAYGEELVAIGFIIAYWVLHSEPYLAWWEKRRNRRRLKRLAGRVMIR